MTQMKNIGPRLHAKLIVILLVAGVAGLALPVISNDSDGRTYSSTVVPSGIMSTDYLLDFSTYFGGSNWEHTRDVFADAQGNVYIVGGTASTDFPTTAGAYDTTFNSGGTQSPQMCDAYVVKFAPNGTLLWSTYLGGPNYDRAYGVEVDAQGYVYISGRAGVGFPVTPGSFQSTFEGTTNPTSGYGGMQNGFVAKLSPNGTTLLWAGYVGISSLARDIAIDSSGDVYVPMGNDGGGTINSSWFANAFQKTQQGGSDSGILKISGDGSHAIWATWLGGSGDDSGAASVRVDSSGYVYIGTSTYSTDIPTTPGAFDHTHNGAVDFYVAKLTPDGSNLSFATYIGGSGNEWISTHNLAIDKQGNTYVAIPVSSNYPTTAGAYQTTFAGGNTDWGISKFNSTGALVASTFVGGSGQENADGVYVDDAGNVFVTGETPSANFPVTGNAFQTTHGGVTDAVVLGLSSDFSHLLYSTFLGGPNDDKGRNGFMDDYGNLYVAGSSNGPGWPTKNANQAAYAGGTLDTILAKFSPQDLPPTIEAWEPGGTPGQSYLVGDTVTVRWGAGDNQTLPPNPINISYGNPSGSWTSIASFEMNDGIYSWDTVSVLPGTYWMNLTVYDSSSQSSFDVGNYSFDIVAPDYPPTIEAREPGGTPGQVYVQGTAIDVRWAASDDHPLPANPVNISYGDAVGGWTNLATAEANDGLYSWDTMAVLPGSYWMNLTVYDLSSQSSFDVGNYSFDIVAPDNPPMVTAFEPGGTSGQSYLVGDLVIVRWGAGDDLPLPPNPINISYGDPSGGWTSIASFETNDGIYSWSTANVPPGTYWINISVFDSASQSSLDVGNYSYQFTVPDDTPPTADAGPDQNVVEGTVVTFDGSLSTDDSGTIANYTWSFTFNGSAVTLFGVNPSFNFTKVGTYVVTLTVLDPSDNSDTDTMTVNVTVGGGDGLPGEPGENVLVDYWWALLIAIVAVVLFVVFVLIKKRRKKKDVDVQHTNATTVSAQKKRE